MSIQFKSVNYIYDPSTPYETKALSDIELAIPSGRFVGCIGHTGSGKSTLIQLINGLLKPTSGQIIVGDTDISAPKVKLADIRKKVGLVFQYPEYQLFEENIFADVAYGPKNLGLTEAEKNARVTYALQAVGMDDIDAKNTSPFELSGGQKRRVAIAGVLAMKPEVLILDEPTAGLDPAGRHEILELIKREHQNQQRTTILVSHSMEDVAKYVDDILVLHAGRIIYFDAPKNVFKHAEQLANMGLDIPEISKIVQALNQNGFAIAEDIFEIEPLLNALEGALKE